MKQIYLTLSVLTWLVSFSCFAKEFSVLSYHNANPPYSYMSSDKLRGIFPDIFSEVEKLTGHTFKFQSYSVIRGQMMFDKGMVDIEPGISPMWRLERPVPGIYSIPYAFSQEVIISSQPNLIQEPKQLYGELVGIVRGYRYNKFEQHFGPFKIQKIEGRSEPDLLNLLEKKRVTYALMGATTAKYYINNNPKFSRFNIVHTVQKVPVSIRLQPHLTQLQTEINNALKEMIQTGKLEQIYLKNTGSDFDLKNNQQH